MWLCSIDWSALGTWVVGGGAIYFARVQANIYREQRNIQEQAHRQAMFVRRFEIYEAVSFFIDNHLEGKDDNEARLDRYQSAIYQAPFVLSQELNGKIGAIIAAVVHLRRERMKEMEGEACDPEAAIDTLRALRGTLFEDFREIAP